jgi:protein-disulfide isomerase
MIPAPTLIRQFAFLGVIVVGLASLVKWPGSDADSELDLTPGVSLEGARTHGVSTAPLGMVVFSDFECPACSTFALDVLPGLEANYVATGRLLIGLRHLPSVSRPSSRDIAAFAECAARQVDFWLVHERLFQNPTQMDEARRGRLFPELQRAEALECLASGDGHARVDQDLRQARQLGLRSTPAILVGLLEDNRLSRTQSVDDFGSLSTISRVLDELLSWR